MKTHQNTHHLALALAVCVAVFVVAIAGAIAGQRAQPIEFYRQKPPCSTAQEVLLPYEGRFYLTGHIRVWMCL